MRSSAGAFSSGRPFWPPRNETERTVAAPRSALVAKAPCAMQWNAFPASERLWSRAILPGKVFCGERRA